VLLVVLFATLVANPLQVHGWGSLFGASTGDDKPVEEVSTVGDSSGATDGSNEVVSPEAAKMEPDHNEPTTSGQSVNENTVVSSQQVREQHSTQEVPRGALAAVDAGQKNALALTDNGPEEQALAVVEQDQATEGDVVTKKVEAPKTDPLPIFEPEEEWKRILPGQQIPGGLDVRINLQTGEKFARLMPESSSSTHWSNKRKRNLKGEDQGVTDETIMVADHIRPSQNKTKPGNGKNMRLDINDVSEDDLSPLDPGMKSAQMIERVLNRLPMPPEELKTASKLSPEKYKEVMQLLWKKRQLELKEAEKNIHDSAKAMQAGTDILLNTSSTDDEKLQVLRNMEYEVQQLDNAMDFATIGGLAATVNLLDHPNGSVRKYAAWVIGTAVKNYKEVQLELLNLGGIETFINVLLLESKGLSITTEGIGGKHGEEDDVKTIDVVGKQLYGLGASLRGSLKSLNYFYEKDGGRVLHKILSQVDEAIDKGPLTEVSGPKTTNGERAWTPETRVLKRKLCGVQNKVLNLMGDNLDFAIQTIGHFGGVEMKDGTNGVLIAKSLTTFTWCKTLEKLSESLCDDDVSREKIMRAFQIILQIAKRGGENTVNAQTNSARSSDLSKCFQLIRNSKNLKSSLQNWKKEWENAVLEDPDDEYAKDLSSMVDSILDDDE